MMPMVYQSPISSIFAKKGHGFDGISGHQDSYGLMLNEKNIGSMGLSGLNEV